MMILSYANRTASSAVAGSQPVDPLWRRFLRRVLKKTSAGKPRAKRGGSHRNDERTPIFEISRAWEDRWVVRRPGGIMDHAFANLESAVAFVRHESRDRPATVELRIGDLYVVADYDPREPSSLFGEPT